LGIEEVNALTSFLPGDVDLPLWWREEEGGGGEEGGRGNRVVVVLP